MSSKSAISVAALVRDTFREALARKIFWGFLACSTAFILFFLFIMKIDIVQGAMATISLFGHEGRTQDLSRLVREFYAGLAAFLYSMGMFLAIFASAGLIPAMFEPGRIELLLSKPVRRAELLLGRYVGNILVVACNVLYLVLAVWLIFGFKTGVWMPGFLYSTVLIVFIFAVLLSLVLLISVLTESAAVSIMATFAVMIVSPILAQQRILERLLTSQWSRDVARVLYDVLPKVFDLGRICRELALGRGISDWAAIWSSALFACAMLLLSVYVFSRKDY